MIGVDIGTSGCKTMFLNRKGDVVSTSSRGYKTYHPKTGWAEQRPEEWYEAFKHTIKCILDEKEIQIEDIASIAIDGMMNSPTFLDEEGNVLRPSIIWMDERSETQKKRLEEETDRKKKIRSTNGPLTSTAMLTKILWVKENQPEIWDRTYKILLPKDYLRFKLVRSFTTDWSDASATQIFDMNRLCWSEEICEAAEIDPNKLPRIVSSTKVVGQLSRDAAKDIGLSEGVPIIAGSSDAAADNLTAGAIKPNQFLIRLGTSGALFKVVSEVPSNLLGRFYVISHCVNNQLLVHSLTPAGYSNKWFKDVFLEEEKDLKDTDGNVHARFEKLAERASAGSRGLLFHPYLIGEHSPRRDFHLRGSFLGITSNHEKQDFARAVLEGVAFSLKECFEEYGKSGQTDSIKMVGGGTKSPLWLSIISDILDVAIEVPKQKDASFGAAMLGGIGIGLFKSPREAVRECVEIEKTVKPSPTHHETYEKLFDLYKKSLDNLQTFEWLNSLK